MRRADRLFRIVQGLRRRGATTARQLAEALEVSERTIYRDIRDLLLSGVPIQGEAGYALDRSYELPPLMFDEEEIEALVLGARIVRSWADKKLARAAEEALQKIEAVLPPRLKSKLAESALMAPGFHVRAQVRSGLEDLRRAIREQRKARFQYVDKAQAGSERTVHPLGLAYWGQTWTLTPGARCAMTSGTSASIESTELDQGGRTSRASSYDTRRRGTEPQSRSLPARSRWCHPVGRLPCQRRPVWTWRPTPERR
jgi:predicted DNA-binding transcriptional regulator YafY